MSYSKDKKLYFNGVELTDIVIPDGITSVREETFYGCSGLKSVTISNGVKSIGNYAFSYCASLETVYWNATNCTGGYFVEDSSFASVSAVFSNCDNLTALVIGENVKSIPEYAFYKCSGLTSIIIPDGVTFIGKRAFENCGGLTSVTIGKGVTTIGEVAFKDCDSLESVYWNATDCAGGWFEESGINPIFYNCDNLTTVVIGESVQAIPSYLFYHNGSLKSVTIGEGVTTIGKSVFASCTSLEIVYWNAIECECGWVDGSIYLLFANCGNLKTLVIGDSVEGIPEYAFYKCSSLESVVIPASLYYVDKYAFEGCSLNTVFYLGGEDDYFSVSGKNGNLIDALHYYSEEEPTDDGSYWHYDENGEMSVW